MRRVIAIVFGVVSAFAAGCSQSVPSCSDLKRIVDDESKRVMLLSWVNENFYDVNRFKDHMSLVAGGPTGAVVNVPFDWTKYGLPEARGPRLVKLVGKYVSHDPKTVNTMKLHGGSPEEVYFQVNSVYVGESRRGLVIGLPNAASDSLDIGNTRDLVRTVDNVAVYCPDSH